VLTGTAHVTCFPLQSYNPNMDIFGVVRLTFSWRDSGVISMTADIAGLPAAANAVSGWVGSCMPLTCHCPLLALAFACHLGLELQQAVGWQMCASVT
jgi:hypothetical protein